MFKAKINRIFEAASITTDTELASILGIKPPSVAGARKREAVPGDWIEKIAKDYHVSADWLLFGRGPMRFGDTPQPVEPQAQTPPEPPETATCARCAKLEEKMERLEEERRELSAENRQLNAEIRQLAKENGELRTEVAVQREQLKSLSGRSVVMDCA